MAVLAAPYFGSALALSSNQQSIGGNAFGTRNLVAPASLAASASGHDVALSWPAGQNGNGYSVLGAANGNSSNCSGANFSSLGSTASTSYLDTGRHQPQGTFYCYQVQTTYGSWSSASNNPIAASQIGFVANTVQLINGGTAGVLDTGDQVVVNFNQAVNTTTGPSGTDTVCPSSTGILLGSTTTSGSCDTAVFRVGSFTKSTSTGTQTVAHQLGTTPKAVILWTNGKTNESFSGSFLFAYGVTDGTTSKSVSAASQDAVTTSAASTRIANKAITIVQWGQVTLAEADLSSWDATNLTLNWTTNNATGYVIHFIAIGGSGVSAKVVGWTMATATGNKAVTGVGFKPDVVIHAFADATFTNSPPASLADATVGWGVMDGSGNQWVDSVYSRSGVNPSDTQRGQQTNAAIFAFTNALAVTKKASFVSMDSDGFTMNFSTANSSASQVFSLALKGMNVKAGNFSKSTASAPASQSVTGVGFSPRVVLLSSFQDVAQANPEAQTRLGIGASDATTEGSSSFTDADGVTTTNAKGVDKTSKAFTKVNNNTQTINAQADLTSMNGDGFSLSWTTNDAVATQMLYLALAPNVAPAESLDLGQLTGGLIGGCNCRFNATYAWSNGNQTLTLTIGARTAGYINPTIGSATWTFNPTTNASKLQSSTGGFHICDNNAGGGNCLASTSGGSTFAPAQIVRMASSNKSLTATPTRLVSANTPRPSGTPSRMWTPTAIRRTRTFTPTSTPTRVEETIAPEPTSTLWSETVTPSPTPTLKRARPSRTPTPNPSATFTPTLTALTPTAASDAPTWTATPTPDAMPQP